jgi:ATP-binding cassette, subfamily B, bacterial PglK
LSLFVVTAAAALLEAAVVAAMFPFLRLLFSPEPRFTGGLLQALSPVFNFISPQPRVGVGAFLIGLVLLSRCVSLVASTFEMRLVYNAGHRLSVRLLSAYVNLPYELWVQADVARSMKNVLQECDQIVQGALRPLVQMTGSAMTLLAICIVLIRVSSRSAAEMAGALALAYGAFYVVRRRRVHGTGAERARINRQRFKTVTDVFGGLKEIQISGLKKNFLARFEKQSADFAELNTEHNVLQIGSQYVIEGLAVCTIIGATTIYTSTHPNISSALPSLGIFVFGAFRMLPAFHRLLSGATQLRFTAPTLEILERDLRADIVVPEKHHHDGVPFISRVEVKNVGVCYSGREHAALCDVSVSIPKGSSVAIIGRTGAGKSTLADVFLGLIRPSSGSLLVDGIAISDVSLAAWQKKIGYVPQRLFLTDDTVRANIAFGVDSDAVDHQALMAAADLSMVSDFVMSLPEGFDTIIGERGVRLSGGEQQRIGIARALYRKPEFLVLDEATSDLDTVTQHTIVERLQAQRNRITICMIAHRLTAIAACDHVYMLENGRITASGPPTEVGQPFMTNTSAKSLTR